MFEKELGKLCVCEEIIVDGNCFFRVILYCLICLENYYYVIWSVICSYVLKYGDKF